jgi:hypothetical protein
MLSRREKYFLLRIFSLLCSSFVGQLCILIKSIFLNLLSPLSIRNKHVDDLIVAVSFTILMFTLVFIVTFFFFVFVFNVIFSRDQVLNTFLYSNCCPNKTSILIFLTPTIFHVFNRKFNNIQIKVNTNFLLYLCKKDISSNKPNFPNFFYGT